MKTATDFNIKNIIDKKQAIYILTDEDGMKTLERIKAPIILEKMYYDYPVTQLTFKFLNPVTRPETLRKYFMLKVN